MSRYQFQTQNNKYGYVARVATSDGSCITAFGDTEDKLAYNIKLMLQCHRTCAIANPCIIFDRQKNVVWQNEPARDLDTCQLWRDCSGVKLDTESLEHHAICEFLP